MPMSKNTTLNDLADFCRKEQSLLNEIFNQKNEKDFTPTRETLSNITSYSKVVSIRKSKRLGQVEFVLN